MLKWKNLIIYLGFAIYAILKPYYLYKFKQLIKLKKIDKIKINC